MAEISPIILRETLSQFAPQGRTALLPALHAVQSLCGYLPESVASEVGRALGVPLADVHGVIKFYNLFYPEPVGKTVVQVCTDPACALAGGDEVLQAVRQHLGVDPEKTTAGEYTIIRSTCLGLCEHAPALLVGQTAIGRAQASDAAELCQGHGYRPQGLVYGARLAPGGAAVLNRSDRRSESFGAGRARWSGFSNRRQMGGRGPGCR
jgi:NADH-quinone oxidoreductase subunit F